jgi:CRISPR system Cascade subunit CasE
MAFPSDPRRRDDPDFLKPYSPGDFAQRQVHVTRRGDAGFLFRIDPEPGGRAVILVQSAVKPDWGYAFHNAAHLLAAPPETKSVEPHFKRGQHLRFRLLANPTKRLRQDSRSSQGRPVDAEWVGKRVAVRSDDLENWLSRRAERAGFRITRLAGLQPGYLYVSRCAERGKGHRLRSARYDGTLEVTDPGRFCETLVSGIGPGKAFGFGLLSIAPVR